MHRYHVSIDVGTSHRAEAKRYQRLFRPYLGRDRLRITEPQLGVALQTGPSSMPMTREPELWIPITPNNALHTLAEIANEWYAAERPQELLGRVFAISRGEGANMGFAVVASTEREETPPPT